MLYCLVENGQIIKGPISLPKSWNNISNFNCLDEQSIISYGWLPHTFIETAKPGQIIEGSSFEILSDSVIERQIVRDPTQEEQQDYMDQKWKRFRKIRNYALSITDWTQLTDNTLSTEEKTEWVLYRQNLRDLPTTGVDPDTIVFPIDPKGEQMSSDKVPPYILLR